MKKITVQTKAQLDELEKESALTWEGLTTDEESLTQLFDWIKGYTPMKQEVAYVITGATVNLACWLTAGNPNRDDPHTLSVKLSDIENVDAIVIPRFQVGGRWFDDIVANNRRREEEKMG